jgi:hypothetical protein
VLLNNKACGFGMVCLDDGLEIEGGAALLNKSMQIKILI